MSNNPDPTRTDKNAETEPPEVVDISGQPAEDIPDGSGSNTSSDDMGEDTASGG